MVIRIRWLSIKVSVSILLSKAKLSPRSSNSAEYRNRLRYYALVATGIEVSVLNLDAEIAVSNIGLDLTVVTLAMIVPLAGEISVRNVPEKGSSTLVPPAGKASVTIVPGIGHSTLVTLAGKVSVTTVPEKSSPTLIPLGGKASVTSVPEEGSATIVPLAGKASVPIVPEDSVAAGPLDLKIDVIDDG